ncbi:hypothetical protein [Komagataeibacter saccharivorans]|uniref:Uncharacterized protein n=1 Tax=Komagataeibacter saccharivorans TaxID=265959 RepID=A0A347WEM7_9PROT|nr:hypothetical protein [Komagataeibacter saccharivorans]AXY23320.1 hypothetical protein CD178_02573 [Komagataeibacter saccharivorans]PMP99017.1 hypothetical protein S101450_00808 [Komagataeibacter saccharivorans]
MNIKSDSTPKPRKEPHEEWREALIHAWKNRRGYVRTHEGVSAMPEEGFIYDEP